MSYGRGPPDIEGMVSLKVDNLTYRTSPEDLRKVFERCGDVGDVYIPRDRFSRESRGFAFVRYYDKRDAEDAMDSLDGYMLDGRNLRVQMASYGRPKEQHRQSDRRGRYGGSRRSRSRSRSRSRRRRSRSRSKSRSKSRSRSGSRKPSRSHKDKRGRRDSKSSSRSASRERSKSADRRRSKTPDRGRSKSADRSDPVESNNNNNNHEPPAASDGPRNNSRSRSRSPE